MAITNWVNYANIQPQQSELGNIVTDLVNGYKAGAEPRRMALDEQKVKLANALQEAALKHKPTEYALSDALKQAQIKKANSSSSGKGSALKPNAAVANAEYLWNLEHPEGDTTPELKAAHVAALKEAFMTGIEHTKSGTERTNVLNETQNKRNLTTTAKIHDELRDIEEGRFPGTQDKLSPTKQAAMKNDLLLEVVKRTTDPGTRDKLINATNLNVTLDTVNPKNLTQYSGAKGIIHKLGDSIKEGAGSGSKAYKDYQAEVNKVTAAAKQMRLYLKDSIQPSAQAKLEELTKPEAWNISPELAAQNFEYMRDLMKQETGTLVRAATDASLFQNAANPQGNQSAQRVYNLATKRWE